MCVWGGVVCASFYDRVPHALLCFVFIIAPRTAFETWPTCGIQHKHTVMLKTLDNVQGFHLVVIFFFLLGHKVH